MSSSTNPRPPSPSVKSDEARSESSTGYVDDNWADNDYIRSDLQNRVFVDFEVFMKHAMHVPEDWVSAWGPAVEAVKADSSFKEHYGEYLKLCDTLGSHEELPHKSLVNAMKIAFDVLARPAFEPFPDNALRQKIIRFPAGETTLHILEVNPRYGALCDGKGFPRLLSGGEYMTSSFRARAQLILVAGVDPITNHSFSPESSKDYTEESNSDATSTDASESISSSHSRKQSADGSAMDVQSVEEEPSSKSTSSRESYRSDSSMGVQSHEEAEDSSTSRSLARRQLDQAAGVCRYFQELFAASLFRSHAILGLIDRGRLQLYYGDRSVLLVSSAVDFSGGDGLNKFIAAMIASSCLVFKREEKLIKNTELFDVFEDGGELIFPDNTAVDSE